jgi:hypothetical protein
MVSIHTPRFLFLSGLQSNDVLWQILPFIIARLARERPDGYARLETRACSVLVARLRAPPALAPSSVPTFGPLPSASLPTPPDDSAPSLPHRRLALPLPHRSDDSLPLPHMRHATCASSPHRRCHGSHELSLYCNNPTSRSTFAILG